MSPKPRRGDPGGLPPFKDVSVEVRPGVPEWPGDVPYACGWTWRIRDGGSVNVSRFTMSPHMGTHADAPIHVRDGWPAVESLPLEAFSGRALVRDVSGADGDIELRDLRLPRSAPVERLLLRTGRTIADGQFPGDWPALTVGCVRALLDRGLRLLGVDAPSIDQRESKTLNVHHALFEGGAFNLESLNLRGIGDGEYELFAFPLRLIGLDAAPVRAVLRAIPSRRARRTKS